MSHSLEYPWTLNDSFMIGLIITTVTGWHTKNLFLICTKKKRERTGQRWNKVMAKAMSLFVTYFHQKLFLCLQQILFVVHILHYFNERRAISPSCSCGLVFKRRILSRTCFQKPQTNVDCSEWVRISPFYAGL